MKVEEDGQQRLGSWALAMEVKRRVWIWDWDENFVKNFGFLLMEFKVLIIMHSPLNWDFIFCALGFARNVFGVLNIFTSQNHFCICRGILLLGKL